MHIRDNYVGEFCRGLSIDPPPAKRGSAVVNRIADGYFNNVYYNDDKAGEFQDWSLRTGLKIQFNDDIPLLLRYQHSNAYYTSSFYFDPEQQFKQDGYAILSLRAQWADPTEHYTVAVFGDNVASRRYQTQVLFNTLGIGSVWNSPAIFGLQLGAKF